MGCGAIPGGQVVYASMDAPPIRASDAPAPGLFDCRSEIRVAFLGRLDGLSTEPSTADAAHGAFVSCCDPAAAAPAINWQIHSDLIVPVSEAPREADGLFDPGPRATSTRPGSAADAAARGGSPLTIFTADCVPVLLGEPAGATAALHAGWRGLAAGILGKGVSLFDDPVQLTAWIGPAIGACCYEVDDDVALAVARTCDASVVRPGRRERPHLDLERAARLQLQVAGVRDVRVMRCCTRCDSAWHSYRREGPGQGRNHAFIWRSG